MNERNVTTYPERSVEAETRASTEQLSDTQVESSFAYMTRVMQELHTRSNGCAEVTRIRVDAIAKDVGISPLQMREVLARMGLDEQLNSVHERMHRVIQKTAEDLQHVDN